MPTVTFIDETTGGTRDDGWALHIAEERLTLRELLRRRVYQEVTEFNARNSETFRGLVQPAGSQRTSAGYVVRPGSRVDWEKQYELAVESFRRNGFVVLVGEHQVDDLDVEVDLPMGTEVTFLKLVALVGG
jgi:hypothetical protein